METEVPSDIPIAPGKSFPTAFAVWDGSRGDRNGQKQITIWHLLEVER